MTKLSELDTGRIQALNDGIFAVVITILVLQLKVPEELSHSELVGFLLSNLMYQLLIFFLSFVILGAFWIDSHYHHHLIVKTNRISIWLNITFLMFICLIPFSTDFMASYSYDRMSIIVYSCNLVCASLCHLCMLLYSWKKKFIMPHISTTVYRNMILRIMIPIVVYISVIPLSFFFKGWITLLFTAPLFFQIVYGRSKEETEI
jgi:uncharacterized membrane protein